MLLRLQNSLSSMREMMRQQERVANNLANVNTVGYKRDRSFAEAFGERLDDEGAPRSERVGQQWAQMSQGQLEATGNVLDLALEGEGFFVVTNESTGTRQYTRGGRFMLDQEGMLRTASGLLVEGSNGPIQMPPLGEAITISQQGEVRSGNQVVGKLEVVTFADPSRLQRMEASTFSAGDQEALPAEQPMIKQGFLEGSNVDAVREMTDMIEHYRHFESQQKMIQTTDQLLGAITRDLGKF